MFSFVSCDSPHVQNVQYVVYVFKASSSKTARQLYELVADACKSAREEALGVLPLFRASNAQGLICTASCPDTWPMMPVNGPKGTLWQSNFARIVCDVCPPPPEAAPIRLPPRSGPAPGSVLLSTVFQEEEDREEEEEDANFEGDIQGDAEYYSDEEAGGYRTPSPVDAPSQGSAGTSRGLPWLSVYVRVHGGAIYRRDLLDVMAVK